MELYIDLCSIARLSQDSLTVECPGALGRGHTNGIRFNALCRFNRHEVAAIKRQHARAPAVASVVPRCSDIHVVAATIIGRANSEVESATRVSANGLAIILWSAGNSECPTIAVDGCLAWSATPFGIAATEVGRARRLPLFDVNTKTPALEVMLFSLPSWQGQPRLGVWRPTCQWTR